MMIKNSLPIILVVLLIAGCSKAHNPIQEPLIELKGQEDDYRSDVDLSFLEPSKGTLIGIAVASVLFYGLYIYQLIEEYKMYERYNNYLGFGVETIYPQQMDPALVYQPGANDVGIGDDMWFEEEIANNQAIVDHYNVAHQHDLAIGVDHYVHDHIPQYHHDPEGQGQWQEHHNFHHAINHNQLL